MSLPTSTEVYDFLEDYGVSNDILQSSWISDRINFTIVPFIENKIKKSLESEITVSEYYDGNGSSILMLRHKKISEFISLEFVTHDDNYIEIGLTSLMPDLINGILKRINAVFPKGIMNLKVTYKLGYIALPEDLKECILYLISELILTFLASRTGGGNPTAQGFSRNYGDRGKWTSLRKDFNRHAMIILKRYMTGVI